MCPVIFSVHFKPSFVVLVSRSIIFTSSQSSTYLLLVFFRCFLFNVWNNQQTDIDRLNTLKLHTRVYCSLVAENTHLILLYLHCSCSLSSGTRLEGVRLPAWQTDKSFLGWERGQHAAAADTLTDLKHSPTHTQLEENVDGQLSCFSFVLLSKTRKNTLTDVYFPCMTVEC